MMVPLMCHYWCCQAILLQQVFLQAYLVSSYDMVA